MVSGQTEPEGCSSFVEARGVGGLPLSPAPDQSLTPGSCKQQRNQGKPIRSQQTQQTHSGRRPKGQFLTVTVSVGSAEEPTSSTDRGEVMAFADVLPHLKPCLE